jgi:uncharacterized protein (TIGR01777 family)
MRALITGGTGFIGRSLFRELDQPFVLSRNPENARGLVGDLPSHAWKPQAGPPPVGVFEGIDVVFHLAGERVGQGRWTKAKKDAIYRSRIEGTRNLVEALRTLSARPRVLVAASAVGFYGSRGDEELDEQAGPGEGFLAEVCRDWEKEAQVASELGVRVVNVRIGLVLGRGGGAMSRMLPLFRKGLGGRLGRGDQWWPWIHIEDVVGIMLHAARRDELIGPVNAVSPSPVTNRQFTRALAKALRRPAFFPGPAFALKIALGEFASVLLASQRVSPSRALETGFSFRHPELDPALENILGRKSSA